MTSTFISTSALSEATRSSLMKLQTKLAQAQKEVATGRFADVGLSLGFKTGQAVSLRQEHARLQSITETNGLVASRLDATQAALKSLAETAQSFQSELLGARNSDYGAEAHPGTGKDRPVGLCRHAQHRVQRRLAVRRHQCRREADRPTTTSSRRRPMRRRWRARSRRHSASRQSDPAGVLHLRRPTCRLSRWPVRGLCSIRRLERHLVGRLRPEREEPHLDQRADRDVRQCQRRGLPQACQRLHDARRSRHRQAQPERLPGRRRHGRAHRQRGGARHHRAAGETGHRPGARRECQRPDVNPDRHHDQSHRRPRRRRPLRSLEPPRRAADASRNRLRHDGPHPEAEPAQLPPDRMAPSTT